MNIENDIIFFIDMTYNLDLFDLLVTKPNVQMTSHLLGHVIGNFTLQKLC